ncbi:MAG: HDIG domain-containing protein [Bacteroidales bacterium]|nr:HDIG domain-containing protein [Bacteroidales bacterium]
MPKQKLTTRQIVVRTLFILLSITLITWCFPRQENFHYEYEVGKPWRYARLTAPFDFPIYRSDSAVMQIEDSIRNQIVPRYTFDAKVAPAALKQLEQSGAKLPAEAAMHLQQTLEQIYQRGIITGEEQDRLLKVHPQEVILINGDVVTTVPKQTLLSELQAYELLRNDSLFAQAYEALPLQRLLSSNLVSDTAAMNLEYKRLRQQVSYTSGVVLAESRIIDNGEIVTPRTFDIINSYRREQQHRRSLSSGIAWEWVGRISVVALLICGILVFLGLYRRHVYIRQVNIFVIIGSITIMAILTSIASHMEITAVYLVPIGIVTIIVSTFFGSRTAFFCHIVMVLLCSFIAPSRFEYVIIQSIVGMIIVFSLKDGLQDRKQLMHTCVFAGIGYLGTYLIYTLANQATLAGVSASVATMMVLNAILLLLSYLIIYSFENIFGFTSGVTLVELCNMGKGLLLRLSEEAPGTFNHSLNVANLSAAAAKEIGANIALVRTGSLYHDIGKLASPNMFTENQQYNNPLNDLSIEDAVLTIKRHVTNGLRLAEKQKLPDDITGFIRTHHGSSQVRYFFVKWCNEHPDQEPDRDFFSYPGPDPVTKEQAIVMMADKIEAASRSLKQPTRKSIRELVERLIGDILNDGRLNDADISLHEIQQCKEVFINQLITINHARIEYPTLNANTAAAKAEAKESETKSGPEPPA